MATEPDIAEATLIAGPAANGREPWPDRDRPPRADVDRLAQLAGCNGQTVSLAYLGCPCQPSVVRRIATAANMMGRPPPRLAIDLRRAARSESRGGRASGRLVVEPSSAVPSPLADSLAGG
jgi:hypothetical protein